MPFLLEDASPELKNAVQSVEDRADECYKLLRLLKRPANEARWALLTAMALALETLQQQNGKGMSLKIRMVNLDRCTSGFKFISEHGKPVSQLAQKYTWHGSLMLEANHALQVTERYSDFLSVFPMWHKNQQQVDPQPDGRVRFNIPRDSSRQRQVIAFQQSFRARESEIASPYSAEPSKAEPAEAMRLLDQLWQEARPRGTAKKFAYEPSGELVEALRGKYQDRLDENFRHPDKFHLNGYFLGEFKSFYIALLILCSIHEYICYPFNKPGQPIPISSLVMVKTRSVWTAKLSQISGLPRTVCETIISDLTLDPVAQPGASMCIHPFVPLDRSALAVAPQFPLASAADDNILRSFSYRYPALFSAQNTEKEGIMRDRIKDAAPHFRPEPSIALPDKSTEIDLLLSDEASSTIVFVELKWIRKPYRTLERIARDKDVEKGLSQLQLIRSYARNNPHFLSEKGKVQRSLTTYANVHYLLVVWDHWFWIDPQDAIAIVNFDALLPALSRSVNLQSLVAELLSYDWLPVEDRDFRVSYTPTEVNGAIIESAIFSLAN